MKKSLLTKIALIMMIGVLIMSLTACGLFGGGDDDPPPPPPPPPPGLDFGTVWTYFTNGVGDLGAKLDAVDSQVYVELGVGIDVKAEEDTQLALSLKANLDKANANNNAIALEIFKDSAVLLGLYTADQKVWFTETITSTSAKTFMVDGVQKYNVGKLLGEAVLGVLGGEDVQIGKTINDLLGEGGTVSGIVDMVGPMLFVAEGPEDYGSGQYSLVLGTAGIFDVLDQMLGADGGLRGMLEGLLDPALIADLSENPAVNDLVKMLIGITFEELLDASKVPTKYPKVAITFDADVLDKSEQTTVLKGLGIEYINDEFSFMGSDVTDVDVRGGVTSIKVSSTLADKASIVPSSVSGVTKTPAVKVSVGEFKITNQLTITADLVVDPKVGVDGLKAVAAAKIKVGTGATEYPIAAQITYDANQAYLVFDTAAIYDGLTALGVTGLVKPASTTYKLPFDLYGVIGKVGELPVTPEAPQSAEGDADEDGGIMSMLGSILGMVEGAFDLLTGLVSEDGKTVTLDFKAIEPFASQLIDIIGLVDYDAFKPTDNTFVKWAESALNDALPYADFAKYVKSLGGVDLIAQGINSYTKLVLGKDAAAAGLVISLTMEEVAATGGLKFALSIKTGTITIVSANLALDIVDSATVTYPAIDSSINLNDLSKAIDTSKPQLGEEFDKIGAALDAYLDSLVA